MLLDEQLSAAGGDVREPQCVQRKESIQQRAGVLLHVLQKTDQ